MSEKTDILWMRAYYIYYTAANIMAFTGHGFWLPKFKNCLTGYSAWQQALFSCSLSVEKDLTASPPHRRITFPPVTLPGMWHLLEFYSNFKVWVCSILSTGSVQVVFMYVCLQPEPSWSINFNIPCECYTQAKHKVPHKSLPRALV